MIYSAFRYVHFKLLKRQNCHWEANDGTESITQFAVFDQKGKSDETSPSPSPSAGCAHFRKNWMHLRLNRYLKMDGWIHEHCCLSELAIEWTNDKFKVFSPYFKKVIPTVFFSASNYVYYIICTVLKIIFNFNYILHKNVWEIFATFSALWRRSKVVW